MALSLQAESLSLPSETTAKSYVGEDPALFTRAARTSVVQIEASETLLGYDCRL